MSSKFESRWSSEISGIHPYLQNIETLWMQKRGSGLGKVVCKGGGDGSVKGEGQGGPALFLSNIENTD